MRQLYPNPLDAVDVFASYQPPAGPSLRLGMVTSLDGSVTDEEGWTSGLGGSADHAVFRVLRAQSDSILVGANTIRTGRCGPHRLSAELRQRRAGTGRPGAAPIVVVTGSLRLDWRTEVFVRPEAPTLVVTSAAASRAAGTLPEQVRANLVIAGEWVVDLRAGLDALRDRGLTRLLCEGGPRLAGALVEADAVDEICVNVAPTVLPTAAHTRLLTGVPARVELTLTRVYEQDQVLFLRYEVGQHAPPG